MKSTNPNSLARDFAFKFVYQFALNKNNNFNINHDDLNGHLEQFESTYFEPDPEHQVNNESSSFSGEQKFYAHGLINTLSEKRENIKSLIDQFSSRKFNSLEQIELAILLVSISEFLFSKDTPPKVIINEGIKIAENYGHKESFSFINAVLDKVYKNLNK